MTANLPGGIQNNEACLECNLPVPKGSSWFCDRPECVQKRKVEREAAREEVMEAINALKQGCSPKIPKPTKAITVKSLMKTLRSAIKNGEIKETMEIVMYSDAEGNACNNLLEISLTEDGKLLLIPSDF